MNYSSGQTRFGLLPEPEGRSAPFLTSLVINGIILVVCLLSGIMAKTVVQRSAVETQIVFIHNPPRLPKVKPPDPIKLTQPPPVLHETPRMETPKIQTQHPQPSPENVKMEAQFAVPVMRMTKPNVILQSMPKAAMKVATPAQLPQVLPSTKPVHFGSLFGVSPNLKASGTATVAAISNLFGANTGPAIATSRVVGSAGVGDGLRSAADTGVVGRVALAGVPSAISIDGPEHYGKIASAGIPAIAASVPLQTAVGFRSTDLEVLSKPPVRYTPEAKQLGVQGKVILRVTFTADGQVVVHAVVHGLGHGLDQEAAREAQQIKFRPATHNGHPIDLTTDIIIVFQLA